MNTILGEPMVGNIFYLKRQHLLDPIKNHEMKSVLSALEDGGYTSVGP